MLFQQFVPVNQGGATDFFPQPMEDQDQHSVGGDTTFVN